MKTNDSRVDNEQDQPRRLVLLAVEVAASLQAPGEKAHTDTAGCRYPGCPAGTG